MHSFHGGLLGVLLNHCVVLRLEPLSAEKIREVSEKVVQECVRVASFPVDKHHISVGEPL